jgi:hypothetical protein
MIVQGMGIATMQHASVNLALWERIVHFVRALMIAQTVESVSTGLVNVIQHSPALIARSWSVPQDAIPMGIAATELATVDRVGLVTHARLRPAPIIATIMVNVWTASATAVLALLEMIAQFELALQIATAMVDV